MERWNQLPEALRWVLFLPALAILWFGFGLLLAIGQWISGGGVLVEVGFTGAIAAWVFPTAMDLAPRAKAVVGWVLYLLMLLFMVVTVALLSARALGACCRMALVGDRQQPPGHDPLGG